MVVDLFHIGHVEYARKAHAPGDYLLDGVLLLGQPMGHCIPWQVVPMGHHAHRVTGLGESTPFGASRFSMMRDERRAGESVSMTMQPESQDQQQIDDAVVESYFDGAGGTTAASMSMMAHGHNLPGNAVARQLAKQQHTIMGRTDDGE